MLRLATRAAHERVDGLFSTFDLSQASGYGRFLTAQAMALLPVEAALDTAGAEALFPDWPERRRGDLIGADLDALGLPPALPIPAPAFPSPAAVVGGVYVLEGSRLGGAVLLRSIGADLPRQFLAAPERAGHWRHFLALLERHLPCSATRAEAARGAQLTFDRFASAAERATMPT